MAKTLVCAECRVRSRWCRVVDHDWIAQTRVANGSPQLGLIVHPAGSACCDGHKPVRPASLSTDDPNPARLW